MGGKTVINITNNIIVVFANRIDTMRLHQCLDNVWVRNVVMPTPRQLSVSCGLSLKTKYSNLNKVLYCIKSLGLSSQYKIFGEKITGNNTYYTNIV